MPRIAAAYYFRLFVDRCFIHCHTSRIHSTNYDPPLMMTQSVNFSPTTLKNC